MMRWCPDRQGNTQQTSKASSSFGTIQTRINKDPCLRAAVLTILLYDYETATSSASTSTACTPALTSTAQFEEEQTHSQLSDIGRPKPPPTPHQTLIFPADTVRRPASSASVWSTTSLPVVEDNLDKLISLCSLIQVIIELFTAWH